MSTSQTEQPHLLPRFRLNGYEAPKRPDVIARQTREVQQLETVSVPERWNAPSQVTTRDQLKVARQKRDAPDLTYDLDGDGAVGHLDMMISRRFDQGNKGRLTETERNQAMEAAKPGSEFRKAHIFGLDQHAQLPRQRILQRRGKIVEADNWAPLEPERKYPADPNMPRTKGDLQLGRLGAARQQLATRFEEYLHATALPPPKRFTPPEVSKELAPKWVDNPPLRTQNELLAQRRTEARQDRTTSHGYVRADYIPKMERIQRATDRLVERLQASRSEMTQREMMTSRRAQNVHDNEATHTQYLERSACSKQRFEDDETPFWETRKPNDPSFEGRLTKHVPLATTTTRPHSALPEIVPSITPRPTDPSSLPPAPQSARAHTPTPRVSSAGPSGSMTARGAAASTQQRSGGAGGARRLPKFSELFAHRPKDVTCFDEVIQRGHEQARLSDPLDAARPLFSSFARDGVFRPPKDSITERRLKEERQAELHSPRAPSHEIGLDDLPDGVQFIPFTKQPQPQPSTQPTTQPAPTPHTPTSRGASQAQHASAAFFLTELPTPKALTSISPSPPVTPTAQSPTPTPTETETQPQQLRNAGGPSGLSMILQRPGTTLGVEVMQENAGPEPEDSIETAPAWSFHPAQIKKLPLHKLALTSPQPTPRTQTPHTHTPHTHTPHTHTPHRILSPRTATPRLTARPGTSNTTGRGTPRMILSARRSPPTSTARGRMIRGENRDDVYASTAHIPNTQRTASQPSDRAVSPPPIIQADSRPGSPVNGVGARVGMTAGAGVQSGAPSASHAAPKKLRRTVIRTTGPNKLQQLHQATCLFEPPYPVTHPHAHIHAPRLTHTPQPTPTPAPAPAPTALHTHITERPQRKGSLSPPSVHRKLHGSEGSMKGSGSQSTTMGNTVNVENKERVNAYAPLKIGEGGSALLSDRSGASPRAPALPQRPSTTAMDNTSNTHGACTPRSPPQASLLSGRKTSAGIVPPFARNALSSAAGMRMGALTSRPEAPRTPLLDRLREAAKTASPMTERRANTTIPSTPFASPRLDISLSRPELLVRPQTQAGSARRHRNRHGVRTGGFQLVSRLAIPTPM